MRMTQSFMAENAHWECILKAKQKSAQCGCLEDEKRATGSRRIIPKKMCRMRMAGRPSHCMGWEQIMGQIGKAGLA